MDHEHITHQKGEKRKRENKMLDADTLLSEPPSKKNQISFDVQCPQCNKVMTAPHFKIHMKIHAKTVTPATVCVDKESGIYLVPKNIYFPYHT